MTATGLPRHEGRNLSTGPGPIVTNRLIHLSWDPYPSPLRQRMLQCRMQKRLMRIGTDIVNVEMVTDDGGRIPPQYQDFKISRFVVSSWDTRTMWTYAAKICQLSHRTFHGIRREFVRKSVGREWMEMTGYPAVWNDTNCVDLQHLVKSEWDQELGKIECIFVVWLQFTIWLNLPSSNHHRLRQHRSHLRRRTADCGCVWTTELSIKPRWRTDILSHWSRRFSTGPRECLSPNQNQGRQQVHNRVSHPLHHKLEEISRRQSNDI